MNTLDVLIVEDDRTYATVLATRCQQLNLAPRVATNAVRAAEMLYEKRPDLILLDVELPWQPGAEVSSCGVVLAGKLKQMSVSDVPIIVLTGRTDPDTAWHCRQAGARFIQKGPEAWSCLKAAIQQLLGLGTEQTDPGTAPLGVCSETFRSESGIDKESRAEGSEFGTDHELRTKKLPSPNEAGALAPSEPRAAAPPRKS